MEHARALDRYNEAVCCDIAEMQAGLGQTDAVGRTYALLAGTLRALLGAVVPAYHVSGVGAGLKFSGDVLGKIYAGQITKWNDPALTALNSGVKLPDEPIAVVHRSDGWGTTGIWTDYLTKVSPEWVSKLGGADKSVGKTVAWPTGIGGKGNEGVSGQVNQTEGAIGYLELQYALAQQTTYGAGGEQGRRVHRAVHRHRDQGRQRREVPGEPQHSLTDAAGPDAYPVSGTTYALVYQKQANAAKAAGLVGFLSWVLSKGRDLNADLNHAPLGSDLRQPSVNQPKKITLNGKPVVK